MKLNELNQLIKQEAGDDPGVHIVFQNMETGEIFELREVTYEWDPESTGATCFIRGEAY